MKSNLFFDKNKPIEAKSTDAKTTVDKTPNKKEQSAMSKLLTCISANLYAPSDNAFLSPCLEEYAAVKNSMKK